MLKGKIALVTGASCGAGHQIAPTLGQEGAPAIMNCNGSAAKAKEVMKEIGATGDKAEAVQCNVSNFENCGGMMADVASRHDRLDILVNNAGIARDNLLMKMSEEDFDAVINTGLRGIFDCVKHISRQMLKQKAGRIIGISPVSGVLSNAGQANYCVTKAGIIGIAKSTARELANRGITVNAVAPGSIATEVINVLSDNVRTAATEQIPMKHFESTQDTAEAVAFLASDKAEYITGQVLSVDGGMAM